MNYSRLGERRSALLARYQLNADIAWAAAESKEARRLLARRPQNCRADRPQSLSPHRGRGPAKLSVFKCFGTI